MQYTQEMILRSDSGYCMPYEEKGRDVQMSLGYGKQKHPHTGEPFFHHGRLWKDTQEQIDSKTGIRRQGYLSGVYLLQVLQGESGSKHRATAKKGI